MVFRLKKSSFLMSALFLLTLIAVFTKSLIPAGFMPDNGGGFTKLVICSGLGEKTILVPSDEKTPSDHDKQNDVCPYQILSAQKNIAAPDSQAATPLPRIAFFQNRWADERAPIIHALFSLSARGPPGA